VNKCPFPSKESLQRDYNELGSLSKIASKYDISLARTKYWSKQLGIVVDSSGGKSIYTVNEDIFSRDSEIGFYLAGFVAADGNIIHDDRSNTSALRLQISRNDREHLITMKTAMAFTGPIGDYETHDAVSGKSIQSSSINIYCSKKLIADASKNFNITPNKTFTYKFPQKIIEHKFVRHFIRGYVDGDGCFYFGDKSNEFSVIGTYSFLKDLKKVLVQKCDINPTKMPEQFKHSKAFRLRWSGNNQIGRIANFLYNNATIYLPRKRLKVEHLLKI